MYTPQEREGGMKLMEWSLKKSILSEVLFCGGKSRKLCHYPQRCGTASTETCKEIVICYYDYRFKTKPCEINHTFLFSIRSISVRCSIIILKGSYVDVKPRSVFIDDPLCCSRRTLTHGKEKDVNACTRLNRERKR